MNKKLWWCLSPCFRIDVAKKNQYSLLFTNEIKRSRQGAERPESSGKSNTESHHQPKGDMSIRVSKPLWKKQKSAMKIKVLLVEIMDL